MIDWLNDTKIYDDYPAVTEPTAQYVNSKGFKSLFEFGCGSGRMLLKFHNIPFLTGLDLNKTRVTHCISLGLRVYQGDENKLKSIESNIFNCAFTFYTLSHIKDISNIIYHLKRISNDKVIICEVTTEQDNIHHYHEYDKFGFTKIKKLQYPFDFNIWEFNTNEK